MIKMKDNILKQYIDDMKYDEALDYIVSDIVEMCSAKFKMEKENIDFEPTLEQMYLMSGPRSQVNNIAGMVIEILDNSQLKTHEKLKLLMENYEFAKNKLS